MAFTSPAKKITYFAVLTALTVVLQLFANAIQIGAASLNFSLVPIVLCGMILGVWYGMALGLVSGLITTIQVVTGQGGLFSLMFNESPVIIVLICILKITVAGFLGAFLFKVIRKKSAGTFVSAIVVPTVNTLIFILGMLVISGTLENVIQQINSEGPVEGLPVIATSGKNVLAYILIFLVGFNYFIEVGINIIFAPALYRVIRLIDKSFDNSKEKPTLCVENTETVLVAKNDNDKEN